MEKGRCLPTSVSDFPSLFLSSGLEEKEMKGAEQMKEKKDLERKDRMVQWSILSRIKASLPLVTNKTDSPPILSSNTQKTKDNYHI